jgi:hypothetical protein
MGIPSIGGALKWQTRKDKTGEGRRNDDRTVDENFFDTLRPYLTGTVFEHLSMFSLRGESPLSGGRRGRSCTTRRGPWRARHGHRKTKRKGRKYKRMDDERVG